jgi:AhpD family alkylhydroperoxidase
MNQTENPNTVLKNTKTPKSKEGKIMEKRYPKYFDRLKGLMGKLGKEIEGPMAGFGELHKQVFPDGVLTTKAKELITLAICITSLCEGCIAVHVRSALKAGATRQEIAEAIGVAIYMGGGPAVVFGCMALEALDQFEAAGVSS